MRLLTCIGTVERRLEILERVLNCFTPVWPKYLDLSLELANRVSNTLLPELQTD